MDIGPCELSEIVYADEEDLATDETRIRKIVRKIRVESVFHPWLLESFQYGLEPECISTIAMPEFLVNHAGTKVPPTRCKAAPARPLATNINCGRLVSFPSCVDRRRRYKREPDLGERAMMGHSSFGEIRWIQARVISTVK